MNTQSDALRDMPVPSQAVSSAVLSPIQTLGWSIRREFWENRSLYIAPLAVAGVVLLGFLLTVFRLPEKIRTAASQGPMQLHELIQHTFDIASALLMITFLLVAVFYCIDALHSERRDRSILFWKSLPLSDLTVVLSKASIPFLLLPLFAFAVTVVTQVVMLFLSSAVLRASGLSVAMLWHELSFFRMSLLLLYHLFTVHVLWEAPFYAWFLMISAWARRAAFMWAVLPPFAVCVFEKMLFNTSHFARFLEDRLSGAGLDAIMAPGTMPMDPMTHITPAKILGAPGLWIGLAVAAAFLYAAVRLRRYQGPI
ncbi:MAG TPA: ABC transporter permease [Candidatus Sulfotelmatobacter sp.]|nr:ABC transporter permease [Candidatus Sulfotelmatobacter sp.]